MLKQLIDVKFNKIFVLQTAGEGTFCSACVWQTVPPCRHSSSVLLSISMLVNEFWRSLVGIPGALYIG